MDICAVTWRPARWLDLYYDRMIKAGLPPVFIPTAFGSRSREIQASSQIRAAGNRYGQWHAGYGCVLLRKLQLKKKIVFQHCLLAHGFFRQCPILARF